MYYNSPLRAQVDIVNIAFPHKTLANSTMLLRHEVALCDLFFLVIEFMCRFSGFMLRRCEVVLCYLFFLAMEFVYRFNDRDLTQYVKTTASFHLPVLLGYIIELMYTSIGLI